MVASSSVAETVVPTQNAQHMLDLFSKHIRDDHGMEFSIDADGTHFIEQEVFRVEFGVKADGLRVRVVRPNDSALIFFKEEIVHHVEEIDAEAAAAIRWHQDKDNGQEGELPSNFRLMTVLQSRLLFDGMQRVTVYAPDIAEDGGQGIHVRLMMPLETGRAPVWPRMGANGIPIWPQGRDKLHARFVTIKNMRPNDNEIDIDIVRHQSGLISQFAQTAREGQVVGCMGPAGMDCLPVHARYFLGADLTGLPAVARLMEKMPVDACGDVVVALPENVDYLPPSSLKVHTLDPAEFEEKVVPLMQQLTDEEPIDYGFFAGEFTNAQAIRKHFKRVLSLDKTTQISTAYWRRGRPGFGS